MSDIRTVDEVFVDEFKVRVARQETADRFDAAVVAHRKGPLGKAVGAAFGDDSEYHEVGSAPIADHEKKYIAVGKAVEQYLDAESDDE